MLIDIYISGYIRLGIGETSKNTRCGRAGLELGHHHRSGKERKKEARVRKAALWSTFLLELREREAPQLRQWRLETRSSNGLNCAVLHKIEMLSLGQIELFFIFLLELKAAAHGHRKQTRKLDAEPFVDRSEMHDDDEPV